MYILRNTLVILSILVYSTLHAQTISGIVYDSKTLQPLLGAAVYYEGTTIGGITDEKGQFRLYPKKNSTSQIIVSYLGYEDAVIPPTDQKFVKVYLTPQPESLSEVVLRGNPLFSRAQLLKAFKREFLGVTRGGQACKILNEEVLDLYYDPDTYEMIVHADESIRIQNPYLGYEIRFKMYDCTIRYFSKSIAPLDVKQSYYAGTSFFIDQKEGKSKYAKRRREVYEGSSLHFLRTVATAQWELEAFDVYKKGFPVDPITHMIVTDTLGIKKVRLTDALSVTYKKRRQSYIETRYDYYTIDGFGNAYPPDALIFSGEMGDQRMGDALPLDYGLSE